MTTAEQRVLELAIQALETQQGQIQQELDGLRRRLARTGKSSVRQAPNKGKPMSAEQKNKIARAMKARWAKIRSGKAA